MIITFVTEGYATEDNAQTIIYDNCEEIRIKHLITEKLAKEASKIFSDLQLSNGWVVKRWTSLKDAKYDETEYYKRLYQISFHSNGKEYFILTLTKVFIANDENKTFRVLN